VRGEKQLLQREPVELDFTFTMPKGLLFILLHLQLIVIRQSGDHMAQVAARIAYTQRTLPTFPFDMQTVLAPLEVNQGTPLFSFPHDHHVCDMLLSFLGQISVQLLYFLL
jgi:hypothetical protein